MKVWYVLQYRVGRKWYNYSFSTSKGLAVEQAYRRARAGALGNAISEWRVYSYQQNKLVFPQKSEEV